MKLSVSNIGWANDNDLKVYGLMKDYGFSGLEIAPTRIIPDNPYEKSDVAKSWVDHIQQTHGFVISSMQSIWFGRTEKVFGSEEERCILLEYTKKAIDFAKILGCKNLVFGCPGNRSLSNDMKPENSRLFFQQIGDHAFENNCVVAMEANPPIYNTNFINTTEQALDFIKLVNSKGLLLNLDVGTMVENREDVSVLVGNEKFIHHVHISEPYLRPIEKRELHNELALLLKNANYTGFVSIEVGKQDCISNLAAMMEYVKGVFE